MSGGRREDGETRGARPADAAPFAARVRRALRGDVTLRAAALEAARRARSALDARRERARLAPPTAEPPPARLGPHFATLSPAELLEHFRTRPAPKFFAGFEDAARRQTDGAASRDDANPPSQRGDHFASHADDAARLVGRAREIAEARRWPLLGYGVVEFGAEPDWLRDPASGKSWPLDFHRDVALVRGDGSDVRVVWELNRLAHLNVLARAHAATDDPPFAHEIFRQLRHWRARNPAGYGPNWACAMEVALRAMNLVAAFRLLARSHATGAADLSFMLAVLDEHGRHVRRNLEFSHLVTSNHYLSDVAGLLWLGVCLPELREAASWRAFALRELLGEMDKQVLPDGANFEASTGYHRFATELFLYSFLLCRENEIEIDERRWRTLRSMLEYTRAYLRPDGRAPLVGDADGGQALPLAPRAADDHAYLLAVGAVVFDEPAFKVAGRAPEELFWLTGAAGLRAYDAMPCAADARPAGESGGDETRRDEAPADLARGGEVPGGSSHGDESGGALSRHPAAARSQAFPAAGAYVMREGPLYLMLVASGAGLRGRGSHAHNDSLSVELSAYGTNFLRDPGTYVYTSDLGARQQFRSTAYHSTVEVDGAEQNTTRRETPFHLGNEAEPRVLRWESDRARDLVVAEHEGYRRLPAGAITHRRSVLFDKRLKLWLVEDSMLGAGRHAFRFVFHLAPGLAARARPDGAAEVSDTITNARLLVAPLEPLGQCALEARHSSRDYGAREPSQAACWTLTRDAPLVARWALIPARGTDAEEKFAELLERLRREPPPFAA